MLYNMDVIVVVERIVIVPVLGRNLQSKPNSFCTCCLLRGGAEIK